MASERMTLKDVVIYYAHGLWKADNYKGQGDKKFKVKFRIGPDHPQFKEVKAVQAKLAKEEWKEKGTAVIKGIEANPNKCCLISGDLYPDDESVQGQFLISASSKVKPKVKGTDGSTDVAPEDDIVYSGARVHALLEFRTMNNPEFGKGYFCTLRGVQKYRDADRIAGGASAAGDDEFENLSTEAEDDPTA